MHEYQHRSFEDDKLVDRHPKMLLRRFLVIAFYLSFVACLAALWFTNILQTNSGPFWDLGFLHMLWVNRFFVLGVPIACLLTCYGLLRHLTSEIMTVPERYLDERQRMVRDRAHRSAFQLLKLMGLLVPACLFVPYLPWFQSAPPTSVSISPLVSFYVDSILDTSILPLKGPAISGGEPHGILFSLHSNLLAISDLSPTQTSGPDSTDIMFVGGILLFSLFLLLSALPMSVLAWKGEN
jgi:hypothetical protein